MTTPGSADARSAHRADPTKKNVLILALCQAFGMTGNAMVITVSALVGFDMAVDKGLATLPLALQFTATMIGTIPASLLMRRIGRRAGFSLGASVGCIGGATAAYAIASGSFALFCLAAMLNGVFHAFILYYRFAAADTASETFRPRAISLVMAGGVVAAIAGPELAKWSRGLFAPALFVGSYAAIAGLAAVSLVLLQFVDIPRLSAAERARSGRPLGVILRQPKCVTAILSAAVGYAVMSLVPCVPVGTGRRADRGGGPGCESRRRSCRHLAPPPSSGLGVRAVPETRSCDRSGAGRRFRRPRLSRR